MSSNVAAQTADTIWHGGPIITVNDGQPTAEAVAVKDGRIIAVGEQADVFAHRGDETKQVDLAGRTMLPGFVDSHGHTYLIGLQATTANLLPPPDGGGKDIASLQRFLTDWASNNSEAVKNVGWIAGFGYDDSQLAEQRHPTRHDLDKVSNDLPVLIIHQSGHLGVANTKALELAGVNTETKDPKGGVFRREAGSSQPNGVCEEYAFFFLVSKLAARFDNDINDALVEEGARLVASFGYTTAQEGRAMGPGLAAMQRVADSGKLLIDLVAYPDMALPDSMRVLSATVTRRSRSGDILGPRHRVPVADALKALTIWPAWQHFEEQTKGSIEVGKLADLVILSDNPLIIPEDQLDDLKIVETIKEGVSIYRRPDKLSSLSSPAMFGVTLSPSHCISHEHAGGVIVCGDGCFNHGLSVLASAMNGSRAAAPPQTSEQFHGRAETNDRATTVEDDGRDKRCLCQCRRHELHELPRFQGNHGRR